VGDATLRETLEQVEKQTGKRPPDLDGHDFPHGCDNWWRWFLELSSTRPISSAGPCAITYTELKAWAIMTGKRLTPLDVLMVKRLDATYLKAVEDLTRV
jgi:hypothetical protein